VTYRVGEPLTRDGALAPFQIAEPFVPFTRSADRFADTFSRVTALFMDRINDLVDPEYRFADGPSGPTGAHRFV
jgi:hypothetical protein